jgi:hypothetical protein
LGQPSKLGRWISRLVRPRRDREAAADDAHHLLEAYGAFAYREARSRARESRAHRWSEGDRHWTRFARAIADVEGREIGLTTADRYRR